MGYSVMCEMIITIVVTVLGLGAGLYLGFVVMNKLLQD